MATRLHTLRSLLSLAVARYRTGRDNVQALFQFLLARSLSTKLHSVRYTENKKLSRRSLPNDWSQQKLSLSNFSVPLIGTSGVVQVPIVLVPDKGRIKIYLFVHYYYRHLSLFIIIIIIFMLDLRFFQKFAARKKDSGESTAESTSIFFLSLKAIYFIFFVVSITPWWCLPTYSLSFNR